MLVNCYDNNERFTHESHRSNLRSSCVKSWTGIWIWNFGKNFSSIVHGQDYCFVILPLYTLEDFDTCLNQFLCSLLRQSEHERYLTCCSSPANCSNSRFEKGSQVELSIPLSKILFFIASRQLLECYLNAQDAHPQPPISSITIELFFSNFFFCNTC